MQQWLGNNNTLMYSKNNEDESVITERFRKN